MSDILLLTGDHGIGKTTFAKNYKSRFHMSLADPIKKASVIWLGDDPEMFKNSPIPHTVKENFYKRTGRPLPDMLKTGRDVYLHMCASAFPLEEVPLLLAITEEKIIIDDHYYTVQADVLRNIGHKVTVVAFRKSGDPNADILIDLPEGKYITDVITEEQMEKLVGN